MSLLQVFDHLVTQQAAEAGRCLGEFGNRSRRIGLPAQEAGKQRCECVGRRELRARRFDVAVERHRIAIALAVMPQRKTISVCVQNIWQRL
jgi:hypothetical protein